MTSIRAVIVLAIAVVCESVSAADTGVKLLSALVHPQSRDLREQPQVQLVDPLSYLAGT
jgi:hypothetical protein